jgi:hypothetical protein
MLINTKSYCGIPQNNVSGLTKPGEVGNILALYRRKSPSVDCSEIEVASFGKTVSEEKILKKLTNQKQELPVAAMFINGSGQNEQSL